MTWSVQMFQPSVQVPPFYFHRVVRHSPLDRWAKKEVTKKEELDPLLALLLPARASSELLPWRPALWEQFLALVLIMTHSWCAEHPPHAFHLPPLSFLCPAGLWLFPALWQESSSSFPCLVCQGRISLKPYSLSLNSIFNVFLRKVK